MRLIRPAKGPETLGAYLPGSAENAEKPMPVGKKKPNPWGLLTTCTATSRNGASTSTSPRPTPLSPGSGNAGQEAGASPCPRPKRNIPTSPEAGSWMTTPTSSDPPARISSNLDWSVQDPQRPQSIWWHTDATRVGFRVVRTAGRGAGKRTQRGPLPGCEGQGDSFRLLDEPRGAFPSCEHVASRPSSPPPGNRPHPHPGDCRHDRPPPSPSRE